MPFPSTPISTESIFEAVFQLACSIGGTRDKPSATPLNTTSRVFTKWDKTNTTMWPALYQIEVPETLSGWDRGVGKRILRCWWYVYILQSTSPSDVVSKRMNEYTDALLGVLPMASRFQNQSLGIPGVVKIWPDGQLLKDEGLMEPPALLRIPISILVGN